MKFHKKFFKTSPLKPLVRFQKKKIHRNVPWVIFLRNLVKFWSIVKYGSIEWGYFHYTDMNKFLK